MHFPNPIMNPSVLFGFCSLLWQQVPCWDCAHSINQTLPAVCLLPPLAAGLFLCSKNKRKGLILPGSSSVLHLVDISGYLFFLMKSELLRRKATLYFCPTMHCPRPFNVPPPFASPSHRPGYPYCTVINSFWGSLPEVGIAKELTQIVCDLVGIPEIFHAEPDDIDEILHEPEQLLGVWPYLQREAEF